MRTKLKRILFGMMAGIMVANTPLTVLADYQPVPSQDETISSKDSSDKEAIMDGNTTSASVEEKQSILEIKDLYQHLTKMEEEDRKEVLADLSGEETYELVILLQYEYINCFSQDQSLELYEEVVDGYWKTVPELKTEDEKKEYDSQLSDWKKEAFQYVDTKKKDTDAYMKSLFKEKEYAKDLYTILTEYVDQKDDAGKQAESVKAYDVLKDENFSGGGINSSDDTQDSTKAEDSKEQPADQVESSEGQKEETTGTTENEGTSEEPKNEEDSADDVEKPEDNASSGTTDSSTEEKADSTKDESEDLLLTRKELKSLMNADSFDVDAFLQRAYESGNFHSIYATFKTGKKEKFLEARTEEELYQIMQMSKYTLLNVYLKFADMEVANTDMADLNSYLYDYQMILSQWITVSAREGEHLTDEQKSQLDGKVLAVIMKAEKLEGISDLTGYEEYLKQKDTKLDISGLLEMFDKLDLTSEDTLSNTMADLIGYSYKLFGMESMNGVEVTPKPVDTRRKARAAIATYASNGQEVSVNDGLYYITAYNTSEALQVDNNGTANATNVCLWSTNKSGHGRSEQRWIIKKQSNGWYKIISNYSRRCLDVYGGKADAGSNIDIYDSNTTDAQYWKFYYYDGKYVIKSKLGLVLDVPNGTFSDGANVQAWSQNNSNAQRWALSKITGDTIYLKPGASSNGHGYLASVPVNNMADAYRRLEYSGGTIYFMDTWNVTSTVTLTNTSYVNSAANGVNLLSECKIGFKRYSSFKGDLVKVNQSSGNGTFKNLVFDGNRSAVPQATGVMFVNYNKASLSYCQFINAASYENASAVRNYYVDIKIDHCDFKNNKTYRPSIGYYGAVTIEGGDSHKGKATVTNCTFDKNTDQSAFLVLYADAYLENCVFTNNSDATTDGYASCVQLNGSNVEMKKCTFKDNHVSKDGGVLHVNNAKGQAHDDNKGKLSAIDCVFENNTADGAGGVGVFYDAWQTGKFENCQFTNNSSGGNGGCINIIGSSQISLIGNTFDKNSAKGHGGAIYEGSSSGKLSLNSENNTYSNNKSNNKGGAVCTSSKVSFSGDTFTENKGVQNSSYLAAGGAYCTIGGDTNVSNCTFKNNSLDNSNVTVGAGSGGAVALFGKTTGLFRNNVYENNTAEWGGGFDIQKDSTANIINEYFKDNSVVDSANAEGGAVHNNGVLTITGGYFGYNTSTQRGGAICNTGQMEISYDDSLDYPGVVEYNEAGTFGGGVYAKSQSDAVSSPRFVSTGIQYKNNQANKNSVGESGGGAIEVKYPSDEGGSKFTATLKGNTFENNSCSGSNGGAVKLENGVTGVFSNNTYTSNTARWGGAVDVQAGATATLTDEVMESNSATGSGSGGAIHNNGVVTIVSGNYVNNTADVCGGAIHNAGTMSLSHDSSSKTTGTFLANSAPIGGAIYANPLSGSSASCTLTSNSMTYDSNEADKGGAVALEKNASMSSTNDDFESNSATAEGGAAYTEGSFTIDSGIVGGNTAPEGAAICQNGVLKLSKTAKIDENNDIFLHSGKYITVPAALSNDFVANITPSDYTPGRTVVRNTYSVKGSTIEPKFTLTPKAGFFLKGGDTYSSTDDADVVISRNYTITYHPNGGTGGPGTQTKEWEVDASISSSKPSRTGYLFGGWNTEEDGSGDTYFGGDDYSVNADLDLYAQWTPVKYTVVYNGNNSTSGSTASSSHTYDVAKNLTANGFTRTGYNFSGWNTKADGSGTAYSDKQSVKNLSSTNGAKVNLYAQWTPNTYTIKYDGNGATGGSTASSSHSYGVAKNLTANGFTKTGHTFKSWNTKADGTGTSYSDKQSVTNLATKDGSVVTLYAQWKVNQYTVTYNANGGSGNMATDTVAYGSAYKTKSNTFTRNGYTFIGWNEKADGTGTDWTNWIGKDWIWTYTTNITLYAQWRADQYTITFTGDNGVEKITGSGTYNYGTTVNVTYKIKPGYHIKNITGTTADGDPNGVWTGNANKEGTISDTWSIKASNRTLVVHTEPNTYTVKYDGNGNTGGSTANSSHTYDAEKALTANGFTRTGYSFSNWNTKADGTGTSYSDKQSVMNLTSTNGATVTLYAQWSKNSYYLDLNGWLDGKSSGNITGFGTADVYVDGVQKANDVTDFYQKVPYGSTYEIKDIKSTTGHTYVGVHSGSLTGTMGTGNISVSLEFKTNKYTVAFDKNGGTGSMTSQSFTYGVTQALTANAYSKTGYTFKGWNTKADGSGTSYSDKQEVSNLSATDGATVTLYAQWTANKYTITVHPNNGTLTVGDTNIKSNTDGTATITVPMVLPVFINWE